MTRFSCYSKQILMSY